MASIRNLLENKAKMEGIGVAYLLTERCDTAESLTNLVIRITEKIFHDIGWLDAFVFPVISVSVEKVTGVDIDKLVLTVVFENREGKEIQSQEFELEKKKELDIDLQIIKRFARNEELTFSPMEEGFALSYECL